MLRYAHVVVRCRSRVATHPQLPEEGGILAWRGEGPIVLKFLGAYDILDVLEEQPGVNPASYAVHGAPNEPFCGKGLLALVQEPSQRQVRWNLADGRRSAEPGPQNGLGAVQISRPSQGLPYEVT